jgi:hypothetical protein
VQRAAKICCEGEAEGVAVELPLAVALRVTSALGEARGDAVLAAVECADALEVWEEVAVAVVLAHALGGGEALGAGDTLREGRGEGEGAEDAVASGEGEGGRVACALGEGEAEELTVMVGVGGGPHTPAALRILPALQAAGMTLN